MSDSDPQVPTGGSVRARLAQSIGNVVQAEIEAHEARRDAHHAAAVGDAYVLHVAAARELGFTEDQADRIAARAVEVARQVAATPATAATTPTPAAATPPTRTPTWTPTHPWDPRRPMELGIETDNLGAEDSHGMCDLVALIASRVVETTPHARAVSEALRRLLAALPDPRDYDLVEAITGLSNVGNDLLMSGARIGYALARTEAGGRRPWRTWAADAIAELEAMGCSIDGSAHAEQQLVDDITARVDRWVRRNRPVRRIVAPAAGLEPPPPPAPPTVASVEAGATSESVARRRGGRTGRGPATTIEPAETARQHHRGSRPARPGHHHAAPWR